MKATYRFLHYGYNKPSEWCSVPCEVIEEGERRYKIKLLAPNVRGRNYGDIISVMKKNVKFPKEKVDCTNEWWNNN